MQAENDGKMRRKRKCEGVSCLRAGGQQSRNVTNSLPQSRQIVPVGMAAKSTVEKMKDTKSGKVEPRSVIGNNRTRRLVYTNNGGRGDDDGRSGALRYVAAGRSGFTLFLPFPKWHFRRRHSHDFATLCRTNRKNNPFSVCLDRNKQKNSVLCPHCRHPTTHERFHWTRWTLRGGRFIDL